MRNLHKKKVSVFGKQIPVLLIAMVVVMGMGSAAVLQFYGTITGEVTANQSVLVDGGDYQTAITDEVSEPAPGGEMFCFEHSLENDASVATNVDFENKIVYNGMTGANAIEGANKEHYIMPDEMTLDFCEKTGDEGEEWNCVDDGANATLTFDPVYRKFKGTLETEGLDGTYALIYYADQPERFDNWGGNNPGEVIQEFTVNGGSDTVDIEKNLDMNLPSYPDANIDEYCYADSGSGTITGDDYDHCHGAKLWIVPEDALTSEDLPVKWDAPGEYLFEKDLVMYIDTNSQDSFPASFPIEEYGESTDDGVKINSGETLSFINCYGFDINIKPGRYNFETQVVPAE